MEWPVPLIRYVGQKPLKTDNVCKTDAVWHGHGADQEVADAVAAKLLMHPDIWALAEAVEIELQPEQEQEPEAPAVKFTHVSDDPLNLYQLRDTESGEVIDLVPMDDAALKAFVSVNGLRVDKRKKGDEFRSLIIATVIHQADPKV